ncbi:MAG: hypothetical protein J3K34DRAFT_522456 [Monoraphidium minutum]|nr:MAG: hypothetical protein J3K34DRAFT_522456 [Monoraphidium minutum]
MAARIAAPRTVAAKEVEASCTIIKASSTGPAAKSALKLKELRVSLTVLGSDDQRVFCKSDGLRFSGGADTTVKLSAEATYTLQLTSTPAVVFKGPARVRTRRAECFEPTLLESCCLPGDAGVKYTNMADVEWDDPVDAQLSQGSSTKTEAKWVCDMALTGRGFRGEVEVEVEVQDYGRLLLPLQAKVYAPSDGSARHGVALLAVEYLISKHSLTQEVRVLKTQYLK